MVSKYFVIQSIFSSYGIVPPLTTNMKTTIQDIEITDWGLIIAMNDNTIIDNNTAIPPLK